MGAGPKGRNLRSSLRAVVGAALPRPVRWRRALERARPYQRWLTADAHAIQREVLASETLAVAPLWWPSYLREVSSERGLSLGTKTQTVLCVSRGGSFAAPLLAPDFLAALARWGGRLGPGKGRRP